LSLLQQKVRAYKFMFNKPVLSTWQKIQRLFISKKAAYRKVFNVDHDVYRDIVMADLRIFARGTGSKWVGDRDKTLVMVGRNDVWSRMIDYSNINDSQISNYVMEIKDD